jgi:hypothetical protein
VWSPKDSSEESTARIYSSQDLSEQKPGSVRRGETKGHKGKGQNQISSAIKKSQSGTDLPDYYSRRVAASIKF